MLTSTRWARVNPAASWEGMSTRRLDPACSTTTLVVGPRSTIELTIPSPRLVRQQAQVLGPDQGLQARGGEQVRGRVGHRHPPAQHQ